jgi:hypothetical protein
MLVDNVLLGGISAGSVMNTRRKYPSGEGRAPDTGIVRQRMVCTVEIAAPQRSEL